MNADVLFSVFKMVSEYREENEYCENRAERTPYTPIPPGEMNRLLKEAGLNGKDVYKILSFAISIVSGLLEFDESVYSLNCANRGNLIVQVEYLKCLTNN